MERFAKTFNGFQSLTIFAKRCFLDVLQGFEYAFEMFLFTHDKVLNPLSVKFIKWSNTLKQFVGKLPTNCLSVFDHFVGLSLKGLIKIQEYGPPEIPALHRL